MPKISTRIALASIILDYLSYIEFYSPSNVAYTGRIEDVFLEDLEEIMDLIYSERKIEAIEHLRGLALTHQTYPSLYLVALTPPKQSPSPNKFGFEDYIQDKWILSETSTGKKVVEFHSYPKKIQLSIYQAKSIVDMLEKIPRNCWENLPERTEV